MKQFWNVSSVGSVGRIDIYDYIDFLGVTAVQFSKDWRELEAQSKSIEVHINSPGGNMYDGITIYNVIQQSKVPADIHIDGMAASSASIVAMAGRKSYMAANAILMIHKPSTGVYGTEDDMNAAIVALRAGQKALMVAYQKKTGKSEDEIAAYLDANKGTGTWFGAEEARLNGFVDEVVGAVEIAAQFDMEKYGYDVPAQLLARLHKEPEDPAERNLTMSDESKTPETPKPATLAEIKAACEGASAEFVVAQMEAQATLSQVQAAWTKQCKADADAARAELAALKAEKAKTPLATEVPGVPVLQDANKEKPKQPEGDAIAQWDALVEEKAKTAKSRGAAIAAASKANPELHDAYLVAFNAKARGK